MSLSGFITLDRKAIDWEWYKDLHVKAVFFHLILVANHAPTKWKGIDIQRGQRLTSIEHLAYECGSTVQSVRTALKRLKSTGEITCKSTNAFTLITLMNYDTYQTRSGETNKRSNKPANKRLTNDQQTTNNKQQCKQEEQEEQIEKPPILKSDLEKSTEVDKKIPLKLSDGSYCKFVVCTKEEVKKLQEFYFDELKVPNFMDYLRKGIDALDAYLERKSDKRKEYKSHYLVLRGWILKDMKAQLEQDIRLNRELNK